MAFIWNIAFFLILIGVLVTVHEFGHFWVARKCGIRVIRFAVGFGKPLFSWYDKQGTEYVVAAIPLGGYVRMLDERTDTVPDDLKHLAFNHKPVLQRIAVVAAGPLFNFLFAIVAFYLMLNIGVSSVKPVIGHTAPDSIAANANIPEEVIITHVNGNKVVNWQDVQLELAGSIGEPQATLSIAESLEQKSRTVYLDTQEWNAQPEKEDLLTSLGIVPYRPNIIPEVVHVSDNSPASGQLKPGDKFLSIDGSPVVDWQAVDRLIKSNPEQTIQFVVNRNGIATELYIKLGVRESADNKKQGFLGIVPKIEPWPEKYKQVEQYSLIEAFPAALERTWRTTMLSFAMVGKLLTGDVSLDALSGPVTIAQGAGTTASYGIVYFLSFMAFISINLGIINLLPLPVLDGGHLLYYLIELVSGKPVPEHVQEVGFRIGLFVIFSLMGIAIFNDLSRL
ncbi:sigma E protease regulator RseP [Catenovulum sp. SM1970]|uniref:sigma E protease regulator RseP n=1 Tax=Marinifaba aquimaris TaxID=2741323 RepID=UPI001573AC72|nr:sigma E protease regulator RseP [Marinifaba aquimaris]NTS77086.1 sigma E protease regulator RseP [Marinifaba aquimaris]